MSPCHVTCVAHNANLFVLCLFRRRVLHISAPIAHDTASSVGARSVTVMGAIYWTQVNGHKTHKDKVHGLPYGLQTVQEFLDADAFLPASQPSQSAPDGPDDDSDYDPK